MTVRCRVCGSEAISGGFTFKPYADFETAVYDCYSCGCRFSNRDEYIYEKLHSKPSTYSSHRKLQSKASSFFLQRDLDGLESYLKATPKFRFIIDAIRDAECCEKVLEYGCSCGYLSSFPILLGKEFYGIDVADTALQVAKSSFGEHFYSPDFVSTLPANYFDLIYHVGTIGCVDDPVAFVTEQLRLLKPGGSLLFNAPNLDVCAMLNLAWLSGTPPPDLVTLFPSGFWKAQFSEVAKVDVIVEMDSPLMSFMRRKRSRSAWAETDLTLFGCESDVSNASDLRRLLSKGVHKMGRYLPQIGMCKPLPQEFGVFVKLTKS